MVEHEINLDKQNPIFKIKNKQSIWKHKIESKPNSISKYALSLTTNTQISKLNHTLNILNKAKKIRKVREIDNTKL